MSDHLHLGGITVSPPWCRFSYSLKTASVLKENRTDNTCLQPVFCYYGDKWDVFFSRWCCTRFQREDKSLSWCPTTFRSVCVFEIFTLISLAPLPGLKPQVGADVIKVCSIYILSNRAHAHWHKLHISHGYKRSGQLTLEGNLFFSLSYNVHGHAECRAAKSLHSCTSVVSPWAQQGAVES